MDMVQNIANAVGGSNAAVNSGQPAAGNSNGTSKGHRDDPSTVASPGSAMSDVMNPNGSHMLQGMGRPVTRQFRGEFLSRPNWLFTHNENVLFCTALNALRFPDHNHVPRKFIEEWLADKMVTMDTQWPAGARFLKEEIEELENDGSKFESKCQLEISQRQREFHKNRKQELHIAERKFKTALTPEATDKARLEYEQAKAAAEEPIHSIEVQQPSPQEIALIELQTKIVRRLQGQTDRLNMAERMANKPYESDHNNYFGSLQKEVFAAIEEKHREIAEEREKVEAKSKQSRKRRRNQVANGVTMSGSATRVRFTNREIAMLIHWIYTYQKNEWSTRIYEYYTATDSARSAEHVRDKMRDLISRSRSSDRGGLATMKVRSGGAYFSKAGDPEEMLQLAQHDLQDFKYPEGELDYVPGGRYFDEERAAWVNGPLPREYVQRYHDEITRVKNVVMSKIRRNRETGVISDDLVHHAAPAGMYDIRLGAPHNQIMDHPGNFASQSDYAIAAGNLDDALHLLSSKRADVRDIGVGPHGDAQNYEQITALASAALKPDSNDNYLHLVPDAQDDVHGPGSGVRSQSDSHGPDEKHTN